MVNGADFLSHVPRSKAGSASKCIQLGAVCAQTQKAVLLRKDGVVLDFHEKILFAGSLLSDKSRDESIQHSNVKVMVALMIHILLKR